MIIINIQHLTIKFETRTKIVLLINFDTYLSVKYNCCPPFSFGIVLWRNHLQSCHSKCIPLSIFFIFGKRKKSHRSRSKEQGGCSNNKICFSAKNLLTNSAMWANEFLWHKIHKLLCCFHLLFFMQSYQHFHIIADSLCDQLVWIHCEQFGYIKKSVALFWLLIWTDENFCVWRNGSSSSEHFVASIQGRIGRPLLIPCNGMRSMDPVMTWINLPL